MTTRRAAPALVPAVLLAACNGSPWVFSTSGQPGDDEARLGGLFTAVGIAVLVIVAALLLVALFRRRTSTEPNAITREGAGIAWVLAGGVVAPAIILVILFGFVLTSLASTAQPPGTNIAGTFEIVGHRWWWEVRRVDVTGAQTFVTANELHIPVGRPVRLQLSSADVIHSFWVPELAGKTDVIPGQTNNAWLQADTAGVYVARCAEYCGMQHAHMSLRVVAESDIEFAHWLAQQSAAARAPQSDIERYGQQVFLGSPCASCHQIRGTLAGAIVGPDLTHIASRSTIGAGALTNNAGNLSGWIANSQSIKPGNQMPPMYLNGSDLHAVVEYLRSLQ
jgi:cytochrome c oxidase subunit 2